MLGKFASTNMSYRLKLLSLVRRAVVFLVALLLAGHFSFKTVLFIC